MDGIVDIIMLTADRYLGVGWKAGKVHSMCIATTEAVALHIAQQSLRQKPTADQVYENIEKLVKPLL
ncbi:MAG: hypothetical protein K8I82_16785 [Anaerolineae bacterium]|nr:hypothetical protein [Anaerolineae bacterium]